MFQINGAVEIFCGEWCEVIKISSLLLKHADLNGCLFGVDNYARYVPLFPDRGLPEDCSVSLRATAEEYVDEDSHASWVLWSEFKRIDWEERAAAIDERVAEFARERDTEIQITKWLNKPGLEWVRDALDKDPGSVVHAGPRFFRRIRMKRRDCLEDTDFPLLMKLMECLAERFGDDGVRLTVYFGS